MGYPVPQELVNIVRQPNIDAGDQWSAVFDWSIAGGQGIFSKILLDSTALLQINLDVTDDVTYIFEFEITAFNFLNAPAEGIMAGFIFQEVGPFIGIGIHQFEIKFTSDVKFIIIHDNSTNLGDSASINFVTLTQKQDHVISVLDIDYPPERFTSDQPGITADRWQHMNSRNGKSPRQ